MGLPEPPSRVTSARRTGRADRTAEQVRARDPPLTGTMIKNRLGPRRTPTRVGNATSAERVAFPEL